MQITQKKFYPGEHANILVAGDVMLDRYVYGDADRISPEAPVPVVKVDRVEERPGGAANVAANIGCLGLKVRLAGITGDDEQAGVLEAALAELGVGYRFYRQPGASTITKLRVLSQNQQLLRLDYEADLAADATAPLLEIYAELLHDSTVVVLSDYAKGSLAGVETFIRLTAEHELPVIIDPKGTDFSRYKNATVLTPNFREFEAVVGKCRDEKEINIKAAALCDELSLDALLVTRGARGMTLVNGTSHEIINLPAETHEVFDVTGAGDTVIATFAAAVASGYAYRDAVSFANAAARIAVEKLGAATVSVAELNARHGSGAGDKRMRLDDLLDAISHSRRSGEKIVMTNGCFDLLHAGHVEYLERARALGDRLVVAVNDDASVRRLKGPGRPLQELEKRLKVLAGLAAIDWLVIFSEDTPERLVQVLSPDLLVKGGDYAPDEVAGAEHVKKQGGEVRVLPLVDGCSTSRIVDTIRKADRGPA